MNDDIVPILNQVLKEHGRRHGRRLLSDRIALRNLLNDYAPALIQERNLIVLAAQERIALDLLRESEAGHPVDLLLVRRLAARLSHGYGIHPDVAHWAVKTWALALGRQLPNVATETRPTLAEAAAPSQSALSPALTQSKVARRSSHVVIEDVLGELISWCAISEGPFLFGEQRQAKLLPAFAIARCPVTTSQFERFVWAEDGFHNPVWWEGLPMPAEHRQRPGQARWPNADCPRESVSWYDAVAFCRWLSSRLGGTSDLADTMKWAVRLPTEMEWEKAARGTAGRLFPYQGAFDPTRANTLEAGLGRTTPVTLYPNGASPYGVMDMSGNVWEWCLNEADEPTQDPDQVDLAAKRVRILRGGSWHDDHVHARTTSRLRGFAVDRFAVNGFRLIRGY